MLLFSQGPCLEIDRGLMWVKLFKYFYFSKTTLNTYVGSQHTPLQQRYQHRWRGSVVQQQGWSTREEMGAPKGEKNFLHWLCHQVQKLKMKIWGLCMDWQRAISFAFRNARAWSCLYNKWTAEFQRLYNPQSNILDMDERLGKTFWFSFNKSCSEWGNKVTFFFFPGRIPELLVRNNFCLPKKNSILYRFS